MWSMIVEYSKIIKYYSYIICILIGPYKRLCYIRFQSFICKILFKGLDLTQYIIILGMYISSMHIALQYTHYISVKIYE